MAQEIETKSARKIMQRFRSPTLDTVRMVERTIAENSPGKKTQIWEKLPRKVMWPTFLTILDYLEEINKTVMSDDGAITYIWNPRLASRVRSRKSY